MPLRGVAAAFALALVLALALRAGGGPSPSESAAATAGMTESSDSFAARIGSPPPASAVPAPFAFQPPNAPPPPPENRAAAAVWSVPAEFAPPERY